MTSDNPTKADLQLAVDEARQKLAAAETKLREAEGPKKMAKDMTEDERQAFLRDNERRFG